MMATPRLAHSAARQPVSRSTCCQEYDIQDSVLGSMDFIKTLLERYKTRSADSRMQGKALELEERLQKLRDGVRTEYDNISDELTDFMLTKEDIILMTARPGVKHALLKGLKDHATKIRSIQFYFDDVCNLPEALKLPDMTDMRTNATALGRTLNSLPSLETVIVNDEGALHNRRSDCLASVVLACRNAKRFIFRPAQECPKVSRYSRHLSTVTRIMSTSTLIFTNEIFQNLSATFCLALLHL